jgi:hypothetical protein
MYLRNVKQILRQASPVFDERAYGYATLVDLLRAAQKEGVIRLDRDRQGVVRVFQSQQAPMPPATSAAEAPVEVPAEAPPPADVTVTEEAREAVETDAQAEVVPGAEPAATEEQQPDAKATKRRRRSAVTRKPRRARKA